MRTRPRSKSRSVNESGQASGFLAMTAIKPGEVEHLRDYLEGFPIDSYLDVLCERLQPEAQEIWGRCVGAPATCEGEALKAYLQHNQIDCGFFYAAYGEATVPKVKASLDQRDRMMAFATRHQGVSPDKLRKAFVAEFT
jgi:hypothetical protein